MKTTVQSQADALRQKIREELSSIIGVPANAIVSTEKLRHYGVDSARVTELFSRLSDWLGRPLSPTLAWEYPTVDGLVTYLTGQPAASAEPSRQEGTVARRPPAGLEEPIALVGLSCRLPGGADSPEAFWALLREGVDAIRPVPGERWDGQAYYDADRSVPGKMDSCWGGFINRVEQVEGFDPLLFGISPREAS